MAKKAYIVLAHKFVPAAGQNTSMKDFGIHGQWEMQEEVFFVTRIRKRWWQEATTIINISDRKIVSNHSDTRNYNEIVQHVQIKYAEHYNGFIQDCKDGGLIERGTSEK